MPTTLVGLGVFLALVVPGVIFSSVRESFRPRRDYSDLREAGGIAFSGAVSSALAVLLLGGLAHLFPRATPDIDLSALLSRSSTYVPAAYRELIWATVWIVLVASVIAVLLGLGFVKVGKLRIGRLGSISPDSAWYRLFHGHLDEYIWCGCELDDGTWVGGLLRSYSTDVRETGDRDLILQSPILLRSSGQVKRVERDDVGVVVVSARRIVRLEVSYYPEWPLPSPTDNPT